MRERKPNSYGFTTTETDEFVSRVGKEAKPHDNFIVASERRPNNNYLTLLVRETSLPPKAAGLELGGHPLHNKWGSKVRGTEFRALTIEAPRLSKETNIAKDTIQRIKNFLAGRVVRVKVEAL